MSWLKAKNKLNRFINKTLSSSEIADHASTNNISFDVNKANEEVDRLKEELIKYKTWRPPGHFYSPIPDRLEVKKREKEIWGTLPQEIPNIDLNEEEQLSLLEKLAVYYSEIPFSDHKKEGIRYFYKNPAFPPGDAILLYSMLRYLKPKKIIEVGSGYSSCVILDTNEKFLGNSVDITFIEPYSDLLKSLITKQDLEGVEIIESNLQDIGLEKFQELDRGDILFIDSTHVSKIASDVNYIFFEILPTLKSGVIIHFHDIFYPFEYPKEWIYEGRAWNEDYLFRAFMQYNKNYKIIFFNDYLAKMHKDKFKEMKLWVNNSGSLWMKKL